MLITGAQMNKKINILWITLIKVTWYDNQEIHFKFGEAVELTFARQNLRNLNLISSKLSDLISICIKGNISFVLFWLVFV